MSIASPLHADAHAQHPARAEALFRLLVSQVSDYAILLLDARGCVESWNVGAERLNGYAASEILGAHLSRFYPETPRTVGLAEALLEVATLYGRSEDEGWRLRRDGSRFWAHVTITALRDDDARLVGFAEVTRDLTEQREAERRLEESEARFRGVLETVRAAALTLDVRGRVTFANDALCALTGWPREELVGVDWFARCMPGDAARSDAARSGAARAFADAVAGARDLPTHYEHEIVTRAGEHRLVAWDSTLLRDLSGAIVGAASIGRDVTAQKASEAALRAQARQAQVDELTGVYNRRGFMTAAERAWRRAASRTRARRHALLAYIDLDHFKHVNDAYGHAEGDRALRSVCDVLRATFGRDSVIGRLGGDEFAVLVVDHASGGEDALRDRLAGELARANDGARAAGRPYDVALSVGLACADADDEASLTALMVEADERLYERKRNR